MSIERANELITLGENRLTSLMGVHHGLLSQAEQDGQALSAAEAELAAAQQKKDAALAAVEQSKAAVEKSSQQQQSAKQGVTGAKAAVTQFGAAKSLLDNGVPDDDGFAESLNGMGRDFVIKSEAHLVAAGALAPPVAPQPPVDAPMPPAESPPMGG